MRRHSIWWPNPFQLLTLCQWIQNSHYQSSFLFQAPANLSKFLWVSPLGYFQASQTQHGPDRVHDPYLLIPQAGLFPRVPEPRKQPYPYPSQNPQNTSLLLLHFCHKQFQTLFSSLPSRSSICPLLSTRAMPTTVHITLFLPEQFQQLHDQTAQCILAPPSTHIPPITRSVFL